MASDNFVTFWLARVDLPYFIEPHEFYVSEARRRLLSQFEDLDQEAKKREERFLETSAEHFNPDYDDPMAAYEQAYQEGISYVWSIVEMQNSVLLAVTAGMYHQFDKKLREKAIRELSHWCDREIIALMIWDLNFNSLLNLLEWIGLKISGTEYGEKIKTCNLVVNVYKHGDGGSHQTLSSTHPEYYPHPPAFHGRHLSPAHDDLQITEEQFVEFADAITAFWKAIPEYCHYSELKDEPLWLDRKIKSIKKRQKSTSIETNQNSNQKA